MTKQMQRNYTCYLQLPLIIDIFLPSPTLSSKVKPTLRTHNNEKKNSIMPDALLIQIHLIAYIKHYQDWNSLRDVKICGKMKFSRDQSSGKLFWSGVPVNRSVLSAGSCFSSRRSLQSKFFNLWPC